jgi:cell division protein FtsI (penicillin-binding protein 3)
VRPDRYLAQGQRQRIRSTTLQVGRGSLLDRDGNHLALSLPQRTIFADPFLVEDPSATADLLAPVLGIDRDGLEQHLRQPGRFEILARTVPDQVADQVAELNLAGISSFEEFKRFNPSGNLARSLVGRVSKDGTDGISGLEETYDDVLRGHSGKITFERSRSGGTIAGGKQHLEPARPGSDLVLTIDQSLQFETEKVLADAVAQARSKGGMAIVSRPGTGEVLAMANVRTDPDTGEVAVTSENLAVTTAFDPGSVNKVITVAGAIEEEVVAPTDEIFVPYSLKVADHTFRDDHRHPDEPMSITDILADSSNVGTIKLAQSLGPEGVDRYLRKFGFGKATGLNLPGETRGLMLPVEDWSGTSIGSIPIGHGISVTAMQMLAAYNVIANKGRYLAPRLVDATIGTDGVRQELSRPDRSEVVTPETARAVRDMLTEVVERGTGKKAAVPGYTVAGKTGTARKALPDGRGYGKPGEYKYVSSFAGFVPAERPELSIIIVIDEPGADSYYASDIAAPAFSRLAAVALRDLQIPPSAGSGSDGPDSGADASADANGREDADDGGSDDDTDVPADGGDEGAEGMTDDSPDGSRPTTPAED